MSLVSHIKDVIKTLVQDGSANKGKKPLEGLGTPEAIFQNKRKIVLIYKCLEQNGSKHFEYFLWEH
jgi:hypothetical protein